jgi:ornithine cyclodeaminase/alanine dehydrogenase-like protein (mu-crystallin family)
MALYLSNDDVQKLMPMSECIEVMEDLFRQEAQGLVTNLPRQRVRFGPGREGGRGGGATLMGGTVLGSHAYGVRHSNISVFYNTDTGALEALIEPSAMAWIRTGAATGVATKYLALPDAAVVGCIGTGRQAVTQLEAICCVRPVRQIRVFSRSEENRARFARQMADTLGVEVEPVASTADCIRGTQIVVTITNASQPVFDGALLEPGMHVNAAGGNSPTRLEVDETTVKRAALIAVDNLEQARLECGELIDAAAKGSFRWQDAVELHDVVSGTAKRPSPEAITLFESQGIGIEDVAGYAYVLRKARTQGVGQQLPF